MPSIFCRSACLLCFWGGSTLSYSLTTLVLGCTLRSPCNQRVLFWGIHKMVVLSPSNWMFEDGVEGISMTQICVQFWIGPVFLRNGCSCSMCRRWLVHIYRAVHRPSPAGIFFVFNLHLPLVSEMNKSLQLWTWHSTLVFCVEFLSHFAADSTHYGEHGCLFSWKSTIVMEWYCLTG